MRRSDAGLPILLMTRPAASSEGFARALGPRGMSGVELVIAPLMRIETLGPLPPLGGARGLIFTSANGVRSWQALGGAASLPAYTVGRATGRAARAAGLTAISADGDAGALVAMLRTRGIAGPLLHLRGRHTRGDVAKTLSEAGTETAEAVIYDQPACPMSAEGQAALQGKRPVIAPLFSPRTAALLAKEAISAPLFVAAMSAAVAKAVQSLHIERLEVAAHPGTEAMIGCVVSLLADASALEARRGEV